MGKIKYINGGIATESPEDMPNFKILLKDFIVSDARGLIWIAPKGMKTDGKSVPPWLVPAFGDPFERVTEPGSCIHDRYCDTHERTQKETHRIFREILLYEVERTFKWTNLLPWRNKGWQVTRAWLMWAGVRGYNKTMYPNWK